MKSTLSVCLASLLAAAALAHAEDAIKPGEVFVERPTLLCLGFRWAIEGDDNRNATVEVAYRAQGKGEWRTALPLLRLKGEVIGQDDDNLRWTAPNLFAGSILDLTPGTEYEVKLTMKDPDGGGAEKVLTVKTRSEPVAFEGGRKLHVYPPQFAGAKETPAFTGLATAYAQAEPGDVVLVHGGVYSVPKAEKKERTDYVLDKAATAERPLVIRAAGDGEAVFDGGGALKLIDCQAASHHFFEGLTFREAEHLIYAGRQQGMQGLVVQRCKFERSNYPIFALHGSCRDFYITDSEFIGNFPEWHPHGARGNDSHAVWMQGQGHVVCHNRFSGYWDGVDLYGRRPETDPEHWNCACDIYENEFSACGDDAIELDYGMHNVRAFRNFIWNVFDGISMQPINGGPAYVWRNIVFNCTRNPIKPEQYPAGLYIVNNTFVCWGSAGQLSRMWQNARIFNNLFLGSGEQGRVIASGTPTPETTMLDYNGWRWFDSKERGQIYWRFSVPTIGPIGKKLNLEWTYSSFAEFVKSTPYEHHGVLLDFDIFEKCELPSGTNTPLPALDLRLRPGSKAVDAGLAFPNLTDGFAGQAPDLGAIELGAAQWAYGPRKGSGK
ncbi:MAG TPA: right-handed parallel beta-helix repeat-containing protein [Chthoniobacteraceae bacterium]|jgi:hypothetical protein|nr:right-handed parallel beta-helix repeat-containing protein [Chthoniobacteraceae bacterium]